MAVLTDARRAVWRAVENYADLAGKFKRKFRYDREQAMLEVVEPSISDLPAIAITPVSNVPEWFTNRQQHWVYLLDITIWTPDWILEPAEDLLEKTLLALYRSSPKPSGKPTYLAEYLPFQTMGTGTIQPIELSDGDGGGTQAMRTTVTLSLSIRKDPFGNL